ncbi:MAG: dihydrofolate reductase [Proteobacteria bacterium]|nr:dihydrofolate reductase [Pseudomonadota bacterium]MDA1331712.1 dihydrofolate reductase [Pseudomonadota bacterium]
MGITIIVAKALNRTIGNNGTLPWHLSADLKRFKQLTTGNTVIMGRKTWDSIGKPLPNRHNIIITRSAHIALNGAQTASNLEEAIHMAPEGLEKFIIGGAEIYKLALPLVSTIEMTLIHKEVPGDTFFPDIDFTSWHELSNTQHHDETSDLSYSFVTYQRIIAR